MNRKITTMLIVLILFMGCSKVDKPTIEKVVISDTAADVLLMDVKGLEDLDDIDSLINELSLVIENESEEQVKEDATHLEEQLASNSETIISTDKEKNSEPIINGEADVPKPTATESYSTFIGRVQGVTDNKIYTEVVRIKKIDPVNLEKLTPSEKRDYINSTIINTGKNRTINVTENTLITLQNGTKIKLFNIKLDQLVSITYDNNKNAKEIKLIRLIREPR